MEVLWSERIGGVVNDTDLCYLGKTPGDGMSDVFGIVAEEIDALYDGQKISW